MDWHQLNGVTHWSQQWADQTAYKYNFGAGGRRVRRYRFYSIMITQHWLQISETTLWSREVSKPRDLRSLWNFTGTSAALLPKCLSNFKAIRLFKLPISWLRDFKRSYVETSYRILKRGPACLSNRVRGNQCSNHSDVRARLVILNLSHTLHTNVQQNIHCYFWETDQDRFKCFDKIICEEYK